MRYRLPSGIRIKAANDGRFRIWYVTHRKRIRFWLSVLALLLLFLWASYNDFQDKLEQERAGRKAAELELWNWQAHKELPPVTFLITARTPAELQENIDHIYGELGREKYMRLLEQTARSSAR